MLQNPTRPSQTTLLTGRPSSSNNCDTNNTAILAIQNQTRMQNQRTSPSSARHTTCRSSSASADQRGGEAANPFAQSMRAAVEKQNFGKSVVLDHHGNCTAPAASPSLGETIPIRLPPEVLFGLDPFLDASDAIAKEIANIRQSSVDPYVPYTREDGSLATREQMMAHDIAETSRIRSTRTEQNRGSVVKTLAEAVPPFLKDFALRADGRNRLAKAFQTIEKREQRRLQSLMLHHARYPITDHPFSISAGVERGQKNRYTNIWPYDHARVKLKPRNGNVNRSSNKSALPGENSESDYVNASFIKAPRCDQSYIATQGPLPTTFEDFWNVVWDQGINTIVMLTREEEGGRLKCHRYWPDKRNEDAHYGLNLCIQLLDEDFLPTCNRSIIRRHFRISNKSGNAERTVVQLQYLGWPDFGVPETPADVLKLRSAVIMGPIIRDNQSTSSTFIPKENTESMPPPPERKPPILVHCSAGCGRTGAFCTIDSTLRLIDHVDGPFNGTTEESIAKDIAEANKDAAREASEAEALERTEADQPVALSAFSTGTFSVAAALRSDPTPESFRLKLPTRGRSKGCANPAAGNTTRTGNKLAAPDIRGERACDVKGAAANGKFLALREAEVAALRTATKSPLIIPSSIYVHALQTTRSPTTSGFSSNNLAPKPTTGNKMALLDPRLSPSPAARSSRDIVRVCVEIFREQRLNMVQTLRQFVFCYEAILWQLLGTVTLPPDVVPLVNEPSSTANHRRTSNTTTEIPPQTSRN